MDCSCTVSIEDDFNGPEMHEITFPKARKVHKCGECGVNINPGEKYELVRGRWEGVFETYKTCLSCKEIRDEFFDGFIYSQVICDLKEYINDCSGEIPSTCISGLSSEPQGVVCDLIEEYWEVVHGNTKT